MRLNINLASRKYEDVRQFYVRWTAALAALAALALLLGTLAGLSYARSAKSGRHIKELQQKNAELEKQRDQLIAFEKLPANHDVTEQKRFWNAQITRRKFSWTQLLNDLQRIMPNRASLVSVQPEMTADRRLTLKLVIEAENRSNARELVERMEASERFHNTKILGEDAHTAAKAGSPSVKFEIGADYSPSEAASPHPAQPRAKEGI